MIEWIGVLLALCGLLTTVFMYRKLKNPDTYMEIFDVLLDEAVHNEDIQKKVYLIGGILGQGLKTGLGLQKATGKFRWQDLAGQIIGGFLQKNILKQTPEEKEAVPIPQHLRS